jgi:NADP-dependent 3-hydroxy acid dehydrogenase YdfG
MPHLTDRSIIISGGTTGAGRATAELLAANGAKVFLFGRHQEPLDAVLSTIRGNGGTASGTIADAGDYSQLEHVFAQAQAEFGGIDVLINNAALPANNIFNTPEEQWAQILNVNLLGYMRCAKLAAEAMRARGGGQILNIGSLCVRVLDNGCDIYVAGKTGVAGFTASLRKELAVDNITVTLLNPGQIASEMVKENAEEKARAVAEARMLEPADVAEAVLFCLERPARVAVTELEIVPAAQRGL